MFSVVQPLTDILQQHIPQYYTMYEVARVKKIANICTV